MATETVSQGTSVPTTRTTTEKRAGFVFEEIAELAKCVERMGVLLIAEPADDRDTEAYLNAVKKLSVQIGLLADFGAQLTGGLEISTFEDWLFPPSYPRCDQRKEANHA